MRDWASYRPRLIPKELLHFKVRAMKGNQHMRLRTNR